MTLTAAPSLTVAVYPSHGTFGTTGTVGTVYQASFVIGPFVYDGDWGLGAPAQTDSWYKIIDHIIAHCIGQRSDRLGVSRSK
jgi:hypothetical protein